MAKDLKILIVSCRIESIKFCMPGTVSQLHMVKTLNKP